jgi:hypothetical protein
MTIQKVRRGNFKYIAFLSKGCDDFFIFKERERERVRERVRSRDTPYREIYGGTFGTEE